MKRIKKVINSIKRFFALYIIRKFETLYLKYPEGVQMSFKTFRGVYKQYPEFGTYITKMYKEIAVKELQLDVSIKPIKKGGEKYHVVVCKDRELKTVFSLKRHGSDGEITNKIASYTKIEK